jgi:hypothetical protein
MPSGRAFVGSVVLHVGALGVLARVLAPDRVVATAPELPAIQTVPPSRAPIEVEIFDDHGPPGTSSSSSGSAGSRVRASRGAEPRGGGEAPPRPTSSPLMTMREPELHPGDDALAPIAGTGSATAPAHVAQVSGRLESVSGGTSVIHDRVTTINVERDGTAHIHDKPYFEIHFLHPHMLNIKKGLRDIGNMVSEWYADPYAGTRYGPTQDLSPLLQAEPGQCDSWGAAMCDDANAPATVVTKSASGDVGVGLFGGNLDVTGYLMHKFHAGDAYASRKLKALDETRDERAERGTAYRSEQLARSAELMRRNLDQLHAATPAELHESLFELWDECDEGEGPTGEAGNRARAEVIGWIRAHLPAGGAGAFTADEIATRDAHRSSKQHFAPY